MTDKDPFEQLEQDRAELARALHREAAADARRAPEPALARTVERGRALRRRRRMGATAVVAAVSALAIVAGPRIADALRAPTPDTAPSRPAPEDMDAEATTFALRAIADAGLMNSFGDFYAYRSTEPLGDGWRVAFAPLQCSPPPSERCEDAPGEDARLDVGVDASDWVVEVAAGPMGEEQRARLLAFRRPAVATDPHPEFGPVGLAEPSDARAEGEGLQVSVAIYWAGPLPDPRTTFACYLRAYDEAGNAIYDSQASAYESPPSESSRTGGSLSTGFPPDVDATRAEMLCSRFTGPGWELVEQPTVKPHDEGRSVSVRGEVEWSERAIAGVLLSCDLNALNAEGSEIGDTTVQLAGPVDNGDPPFTRDLDAVIDVPTAEPVASVTLGCRVPEHGLAAFDADPDDVDVDEGDGEQSAPTVRPTMAEPPDGPRFVVAQGRFEGSDWGDYEGLGWQLQAWQSADFRCHRFVVAPHFDDEEGRSCTLLSSDYRPEDLGASGVFPADTFEGEFSIVYGELTTRVDRVGFELSTGEKVQVDALAPPAESGVDARYYVAFLPPSESFDVTAYDADGHALDVHD